MADRSDPSPFDGNAFRYLLWESVISNRARSDVAAKAETGKLVGIIDSMTKDERLFPGQITDEGRCRRIAIGAGVTVNEVKEFINQFSALNEVMQRLRSTWNW